jgi:hypothetical protein
MSGRIERHRTDRPSSWTTIEEPESVPRVLSNRLMHTRRPPPRFAGSVGAAPTAVGQPLPTFFHVI